ncbi:MAG: SGNH/GDSL hydrolase family protein, partial [Verrucomicrobium sp.]
MLTSRSAILRSLFIAVALLPSLLNAAPYPEVVAFGDSLTDMGNRTAESRKPDLKFRDTWVAQLAGPTMMGMAEFKPSGMSFFYGGTNYAVGGATTAYGATSSSDRNRGQNLTQQVSKRYLNPAFNVAGVKKEALHVIVIGSNDLMRACIGPVQIATQWTSLDSVGVAVAKSTESQVEALAAAGVKNILWGNLFDASKAPSLVTKVTLIGGAQAHVVLGAVSRAIEAHNREMDGAIARLQSTHPGLKITKLDLYGKFVEVSADPAKFGFVDVTTGANDSKHLFSADGL